MKRQQGFTLLEMLAALAVLALCATVLIAGMGNSSRTLQQVQRSDRLALVARSLFEQRADDRLQPGRSEGQTSGVHWQLEITPRPGPRGPLQVYRLALSLDDGVRQAQFSTLQVRQVSP